MSSGIHRVLRGDRLTSEPGRKLKIIGKGYDSHDAAEQALKGSAHCTT